MYNDVDILYHLKNTNRITQKFNIKYLLYHLGNRI